MPAKGVSFLCGLTIMRNLITRTITGIVFVAVLVGCILYSMFSFCVLFAIVSAAAVWEYSLLVNKIPEIHINSLMSTVAAACLFLAVFAFVCNIGGGGVFLPYILLIIYMLIAELYLKRPHPLQNWAYTMLGQMYIALPLSTLSLLAVQHEGGSAFYVPVYPLSVFVFIWCSDTGAYCVGSLFGKHKLFERISPHKTWEGSIGGGVLAIIVAIALFFVIHQPFMGKMEAEGTSLELLEWIGLALVVVVFGTWGDLAESMMKRQLGVKDSGNILPGHGGVLDRFDSSLIAVPAAVIYLYLITL